MFESVGRLFWCFCFGEEGGCFEKGWGGGGGRFGEGCSEEGRGGGGDGVRGGRRRRGGGALAGAGADGFLEAVAGDPGEQPRRDEAGGEDGAGEGAERLWADEPRGSEQQELRHQVREGGGEVHRDAAAERVADQPEGLGSRPGEVRGRGERDEDLGRVQAGVVRQVGRVVGEAAAKQVKEHDPAALFLDEGVGDLGQGDARGADAVDEDNLVAGQGAPFVDPDGAILEPLLV